jgi:tRNA dimethylallyltransferase
MSLARFQDLAMSVIADVSARDRLPVLVGGTPLYMNAIVEGWRIPRVPPDPKFRARLEAEVTQSGIAPLVQRLRAVDPVAADRHGSNVRRIIRALEVYEATGIPVTVQEGKGPAPYHALELGLTMPRERLYQAVDARVHEQIERGLVAEIQSLLESGIPEGAPAMGSLGYRQLLPYLRGESSLDAAVARIQYDTHRYVRHQETWLRRNPRLVWFDVTEPRWQEAAMERVRRFLDPPPTRPPLG